ncbi:hypothetical protein V6N13_061532 [Hibiscus sabdariffa]|uniref:Uncharacterized protein n=1 Tax=Hibiscus sabdariffa TaxID=183260 RepID=A0ABR1ZYF8_9ROSI
MAHVEGKTLFCRQHRKEIPPDIDANPLVLARKKGPFSKPFEVDRVKDKRLTTELDSWNRTQGVVISDATKKEERRASCGTFMPYFFIYYISLKVGSPESEERSSPMRREERPRHPHATDKQQSKLLAKGVVSPGLSELAHNPPPAIAQ